MSVVANSVNIFGIDEKYFTARFKDGKFIYYKDTKTGEIYNSDNYVFGGSTDDKANYLKATQEEFSYNAINSSAKLNFSLFGLNSDIKFGNASANVYQSKLLPFSLGIDAAASVSGMESSIGIRVGTLNNNVFGKGSAKLFSAEAKGSFGVYTGENDKYGLGVDLGAGASVAEGTLKGGVTLLGIEAAGSITGTVVSAHIGANGTAHYDAASGNFNLKLGGDLGLLLGVKAKIDLKFPVRTWYNYISNFPESTGLR